MERRCTLRYTHPMQNLVEVKSAVVQTFEGQTLEVHGGAYLSPEAFLSTNAELERLREKTTQTETRATQVISVVVAASLVGLALGYLLGRRGDRD